MWFDGQRQPDTLYVASVSRGKDSTAMLRAIQLMGWPLDAICAVDVWFDEETPAELPPMVAFKDEWDMKCLEWFGIPVARPCATKRETESDVECHSQESYTSYFYRRREDGKFCGAVVGFPMQRGSWCKKLKYEQVDLYGYFLLENLGRENCSTAGTRRGFQNLRLPDAKRKLVSVRHQTIGTLGCQNQECRWAQENSRMPLDKRPDKARKTNIIHYIGIAADEPIRIAKHMPDANKVMPLVQIGWDEALCGLEAQYMDMLSPTYSGAMRDGCWFCHNQSVDQLRSLRRNYPDLWAKLMAIDLDSPVTFHSDGHTVHDFDRRFQLEDEGILIAGERFRWSDLDEPQLRLF